jgi:hypothetical protein
MTKLLATCLACSLLAACGAGSPEQVLIGAWPDTFHGSRTRLGNN